MVGAIFSVGLSLLAPLTPQSRNRIGCTQDRAMVQVLDRTQPTNIVHKMGFMRLVMNGTLYKYRMREIGFVLLG